MEWPEGPVVIRSLTPDRKPWFGSVKKVELLGHSTPLEWRQEPDGLRVVLPKAKVGDYVYVLKLSGN